MSLKSFFKPKAPVAVTPKQTPLMTDAQFDRFASALEMVGFLDYEDRETLQQAVSSRDSYKHGMFVWEYPVAAIRIYFHSDGEKITGITLQELGERRFAAAQAVAEVNRRVAWILNGNPGSSKVVR